MTINEKIEKIKYNRLFSLERFIIDVDKLISESSCDIKQEFRDKFAGGSMVLKTKSILGNITIDQLHDIIYFIEENFGIKYVLKI